MKFLKLDAIKDAKAYLDALGIIEFYLRDPILYFTALAIQQPHDQPVAPSPLINPMGVPLFHWCFVVVTLCRGRYWGHQPHASG
jgi:hypothetical protein